MDFSQSQKRGDVMKTIVCKIWAHKTGLLTFVLISLLTYSTVNLQKFSGKTEVLASLNEGIQTCFMRVNQTFTAKLLGGNQSYLTPSFLLETEECFGDIISLAEDSFLKDRNQAELLRKINSLSSNVHWFHEKVGSADGKENTITKRSNKNRFVVKATNEPSNNSEISGRFSKIELIKEQVLEKQDNFRSGLEDKLGLIKQTTIAVSFLLSVLVVWLLLGIKVRRKLNEQFEEAAFFEIKKEDAIEVTQVENIITKVLEGNGLVYCAHLFGNFCNNVLSGEKVGEGEEVISPFAPNLITPAGTEANLKAAMTLIEHSGNSSDDFTNSVSANFANVDKVFSQVVDQLASKLFTCGILLDLNIQSSISVSMSEEGLGQVLFQVISNAINALNNLTEVSCEKKIKVNLKRLGGVAIVEVENSGEGFPEHILKEQENLRVVKMAGTGLTICKELIEQSRGQFLLSNIVGKDGDIIGAQVKVVLNASVENKIGAGTVVRKDVANKTELVSLFKGSKKELLKQISIN